MRDAADVEAVCREGTGAGREEGSTSTSPVRTWVEGDYRGVDSGTFR